MASTQRIVLGDCLDVFSDYRRYFGAVVTDPPAGIGFMGRGWDRDRGGRAAWVAYWAERFAVALDACEDDAVGLFWALPRTSHWTATAVEDAGWRIRDVITHHFGQGWPKDKNALKPSSENWILAVKGKPALGIDACRVPRVEGVPVCNVVGGGSLWGNENKKQLTGEVRCGSWPTNLVLSHAESCERAGTRKVRNRAGGNDTNHAGTTFALGARNNAVAHGEPDETKFMRTETVDAYLCAVGCDCGASWLAEAGGKAPRCACGREGWWACPVAEMDSQSGDLRPPGNLGLIDGGDSGVVYGAKTQRQYLPFKDHGGASRFFPRFGYYAKAPSGERHAGCDDLFWRADRRDPFGFVRVSREEWIALDPKLRAEGNVHPTVKRLAFMRWLHKLTGAKRIGDLCGGSGSGAVAAALDDVDWVGAEVSPQAIEIAEARLAWWRSLSPKAREAFDAGRGVKVASRIRAKEIERAEAALDRAAAIG